MCLFLIDKLLKILSILRNIIHIVIDWIKIARPIQFNLMYFQVLLKLKLPVQITLKYNHMKLFNHQH